MNLENDYQKIFEQPKIKQEQRSLDFFQQELLQKGLDTPEAIEECLEKLHPLSNEQWSEQFKNHENPEIKRRFETAYNFYLETGFDRSKILDHISGINFNREVEIVALKKGDIVFQLQTPESNQKGRIGNYFTKDSQITELGLIGEYKGEHSETNRVMEVYLVEQDCLALKSTSADIETWKEIVDKDSGKPLYGGELLYGGGEQYFIPNFDGRKIFKSVKK